MSPDWHCFIDGDPAGEGMLEVEVIAAALNVLVPADAGANAGAAES